MPQEAPTRIGVIVKPNEPRAVNVAAKIAAWCRERGSPLLIDIRLAPPLAGSKTANLEAIVAESDILVVLGGDGTMIGTARAVAGCGLPVIGVNLGWLGYLTEFAVEDVIPALEAAVAGDFETDCRAMLDWTALRNGEPIASDCVLNDVVVTKSALARLIEIDCKIGPRAITTYRGDGLIISTPTGSTAYNLSAGGPIIYPSTDAICIAPICPHTLTNRPIVLPGRVELTLRLITREQEVMLTSDGQTGVELLGGDEVQIKKSPRTFNIMRPKDRDYFKILRDKLKWGGR